MMRREEGRALVVCAGAGRLAVGRVGYWAVKGRLMAVKRP